MIDATHPKTHLAWLLGTLTLLVAADALALPMYGARSGRTCDNCHSLPNTWYDPPEVTERKCTLSCAGCHVDPSGGGLRTVSGRYFGMATLPMFGSIARPLDDQPRDVWDLFTGDPADRIAPSSQPVGAELPASGPVKPMEAHNEDPRGPGAPPADDGWLSFGRPLGHGSSEMAWLDGRYGDLNADPLVQLGADVRFGYWSAGPLFFPMQLDLHAALHPVEHLTIAGTVGARGRTKSLTFDARGAPDAEQLRFGVRELYAMTHEWPALMHLRAGRFMPAFGTRVADHTAYTRRPFGMSMEDPANRVVGLEAGFTGNYPHFTASAFKPADGASQNPFAMADGWGAALDGGWRDLAWQLGGSAMMRRRPLSGGGDTLDLALHWGYNPWRRWKALALTYLGEVVWGRYQRPFSGSETSRLAWYHQLAWHPVNGVVARLRFDSFDPDGEVRDDVVYRPGLGLDWHVVPGLTISADGRVGIPEKGGPGEEAADVFVQIHGWF